MADIVYNRFKFRSAHGDTQWGSTAPSPADVRILLLETTAAGAFNPDLDTVADLLAVGSVAEFVGTNYARGTVVETDPTGPDDTNDRVNLDITDQVFTSLGVAAGTDGSVVAAVFYHEVAAADASRHLISYHDSGFPVVTNGQNLTVAAPNDVLRLT